ncbi:hypothetical protein AYK26_06505 [Euryarchaeota archaeon SM23-78]|nr:MAG: hypothetical protein AYK26_06505 [Euryarchaeota archaeon SM23-78]
MPICEGIHQLHNQSGVGGCPKGFRPLTSFALMLKNFVFEHVNVFRVAEKVTGIRSSRLSKRA